MNSDKLKVRVFDMEQGLIEYENVKSVRIVSKDYNLLIMEDYMPIIGEIVGSVDITGTDTNASYKQIKGFYMNRDNVFNLMIEE
ncbi:MAG: hypothetical protein VZS44_00355 [Bacilli bacterium]|nr:hypothetical protein [Bacilli bacterium]